MVQAQHAERYRRCVRLWEADTIRWMTRLALELLLGVFESGGVRAVLLQLVARLQRPLELVAECAAAARAVDGAGCAGHT